MIAFGVREADDESGLGVTVAVTVIGTGSGFRVPNTAPRMIAKIASSIIVRTSQNSHFCRPHMRGLYDVLAAVESRA